MLDPNLPTKIYLYTRYSTDKQNRESTQAQIEGGQSWARRENVQIVRTYSDEETSGQTMQRADYQRMLKDLEDNRDGAQGILVYKWARIGRNFLESVQSIYHIENLMGFRVLSATQPNDPFSRNIFLSWAEEMIRETSENTRANLQQRAKAGSHTGGLPPYGYQRDEIDEKITFAPHPEQSKIVIRIFEEYARGDSCKTITHRLNDEHIPPPRGDSWDTSAVGYILKNETYRGWRIYGKTKKIMRPNGKRSYRQLPRKDWIVKKDAHPAIINEELWEKVESRRPEKRVGGDRKSGVSPHLLTGLVKCTECGANFVVHKLGGDRKGYAYYRCTKNLRRGKSVCTNGVYVDKEKIEKAVLEEFRKIIGSTKFIQGMIDSAIALQDQLSQENKDPSKPLERELAKLNRETQNLVNAIRKMGHSDALQADLSRCEARKEELTRLIEDAKTETVTPAQMPSERDIKAVCDNYIQILEKGSRQEIRVLMMENVELVTVNTKGEVEMTFYPAKLLPESAHQRVPRTRIPLLC